MNRRSMLKVAGAAPLTGLMNQASAQTEGRIKQSVCRWCYDKMSLDDLCKNASRMGLKGIDLLITRIGRPRRSTGWCRP